MTFTKHKLHFHMLGSHGKGYYKNRNLSKTFVCEKCGFATHAKYLLEKHDEDIHVLGLPQKTPIKAGVPKVLE